VGATLEPARVYSCRLAHIAVINSCVIHFLFFLGHLSIVGFSSLRSSYTATNIETAVPATFLTPWPPLVVVLGQPRGMAICMHILGLSKGDDE
jgi:hypothetical protein